MIAAIIRSTTITRNSTRISFRIVWFSIKVFLMFFAFIILISSFVMRKAIVRPSTVARYSKIAWGSIEADANLKSRPNTAAMSTALNIVSIREGIERNIPPATIIRSTPRLWINSSAELMLTLSFSFNVMLFILASSKVLLTSLRWSPAKMLATAALPTAKIRNMASDTKISFQFLFKNPCSISFIISL